MKHLVIVGGGHAHLFVLERLATAALEDVRVTLIAPGRWQYYSGMLPGWIAGHYSEDEIRLDLSGLADRAGVTYVDDKVTAIHADRKSLTLSGGTEIAYDLLSLDIGSESRSDWLSASGERLLTIKPLDLFQRHWRQIITDASGRQSFSLVVVGGGAAGTELALSAQFALSRIVPSARITLVTGREGFLRGHAEGVRRRARQALARAGIEQVAARATGTAQGVTLDSGANIAADVVLAATGASAPQMLKTSHLALDRDGFIHVDAHHRSLSHPDVFAAGDVCGRDDPNVHRSGVHAVHAGPVLAHNLLAAMNGGNLKTYRPGSRVLYLLACGEKYAIASWGWLHLEGRWVWQWKDRIDRRFMKRFSTAAAVQSDPQSAGARL